MHTGYCAKTMYHRFEVVIQRSFSDFISYHAHRLVRKDYIP